MPKLELAIKRNTSLGASPMVHLLPIERLLCREQRCRLAIPRRSVRLIIARPRHKAIDHRWGTGTGYKRGRATPRTFSTLRYRRERRYHTGISTQPRAAALPVLVVIATLFYQTLCHANRKIPPILPLSWENPRDDEASVVSARHFLKCASTANGELCACATGEAC